MARSRTKRTENLTAYDFYLRALPYRYAVSEAGARKAIEFATAAFELDPKFATAKALAAYCYGMFVLHDWDAPGAAEKAEALARAAVEDGWDDPEALRIAGHILGGVGRDYPAALTALDRALALNPSSAAAWISSGWVHCYVDELETALEHFGRAMRLSPFDPESYLIQGGDGLGAPPAGEHRGGAGMVAEVPSAIQELGDGLPDQYRMPGPHRALGRGPQGGRTVHRDVPELPHFEMGGSSSPPQYRSSKAGGVLSACRSPRMTTRRLAAILAADVVGFSALMSRDEEGTLARVKRLRREVIDPRVHAHGGRVFKATGDGLLAEFPSPVEAVRCAVEVQDALASEAAQESSQALQMRIGINLGDIIIEEDGDVFGEGVNIAARLEQLAEPGSILVSHKVCEEVRGKLPYAFEDRGEQHVKNIANPVRIYALGGGRLRDQSNRTKSLTLPDKPSIAVLPFVNLSADPERDYFADGVVEDIISALSHFPRLFVIARNSSFTYKGRAVDVRQVGLELGVRYVLEGGIRRAGERIRLTGQLIDARSGTHLWAERFDGAMQDIFDLQDEMASRVVGAIVPRMQLAEIERVKRSRPENLDAYDLYLCSCRR